MPLPCICINIGEIFEDENDTLEKYESTNATFMCYGYNII